MPISRHGFVPIVLSLVLLGVASGRVAAQEDRSVFSAVDIHGREVSLGAVARGDLTHEDLVSETGRRVQVWRLAVAGESIQIDLTSPDFDTYLTVVGPGLGAGAYDDDGGPGLNSRLCLALAEAGDYRVVVSSFSGEAGAFTLQVTPWAGAVGDDAGSVSCGPDEFDSWESLDLETLDPEGRSLRVGDEVGGVLASSDVTYFDSPVQAWAVDGRQGESFSVDLVSDEFDAFLYVVGPGLEEALSDDDGAGRCDSRVTLVFPADGTYRVVASNLGSGTGSYVLRASREEGPVSEETCIPPSTAVEVDLGDLGDIPVLGDLSWDEPVHAEMVGDEPTYAGRSLQGWTLSGRAGDRVVIDLVSGDFDGYLYFTGPGFSEPLENDDGGGSLNSRVCVELPYDGTYQVYAGPLSGGHPQGRYSLRAGPGEPGENCGGSYSMAPAMMEVHLATLPSEGREMEVGGEVWAVLEAGAPTHPERGHPLQPWHMVVRGGEEVTVDVVSEEFDPILYVAGSGAGLLFVDDAEGGCNSRLTFTPAEDGTVTLLPGAYYAGATGGFVLRASTDPGPLEEGGCASGEGEAPSVTATGDAGDVDGVGSGMDREIGVGTEVRGFLGGGGDDIRGNGSWAQPWTFHGAAGDEMVIELLSGDFDALLYVDGPGIEAPYRDDDGTGSLDSRVEFTLPESGVYRVVVTSVGEGSEGGYRLRVIRRVR